MANIKIKTKTGFEVTVKDNITDDMELMDDLMDIYTRKSANVKEVVNRMIGDAQRKKLYEHCRGKDGVVSAQKVLVETEDIFIKATNKVKALKKSQASQ